MKPQNKPPSHPGVVLFEEFMLPRNFYGLAEVAKQTKIPLGQLQAILDERTKITPKVAENLARVFSTTKEFWENLQAAYDEYWGDWI